MIPNSLLKLFLVQCVNPLYFAPTRVPMIIYHSPSRRAKMVHDDWSQNAASLTLEEEILMCQEWESEYVCGVKHRLFCCSYQISICVSK
jgi:hypothetical protein